LTYEEFKDALPNLDVSMLKDYNGDFKEFYYLDHFETNIPFDKTQSE